MIPSPKTRTILILSLMIPFVLACLTTGAIDVALPAQLAPAQMTITPAVPTQTPVRTSPTATPPLCATVDADSLHIRYHAGESAQAIGWLTEGTTVKVLSTAAAPGANGQILSGWWKVHGQGIDDRSRTANMTGYVKASYLDEQPCPPSE